MSFNPEVEPKAPPNPVQLTEITIPKRFIDRYGHVNYKRYPILFERGQDDYMGSRGIGFIRMEKATGLKFPVKTWTVTNHADIKKDDRPVISTTVTKVGNTSMAFHQEMNVGETLVAEEDLVIVVFDPALGISTPIPQIMRERLLQPTTTPS